MGEGEPLQYRAGRYTGYTVPKLRVAHALQRLLVVVYNLVELQSL